MDGLTNYLGSLVGIGALILIIFKIIYNLGKNEKQREIDNVILQKNKIRINEIIKAQKNISKLSSDKLLKLLLKRKD
jgi:hypothetical protein